MGELLYRKNIGGIRCSIFQNVTEKGKSFLNINISKSILTRKKTWKERNFMHLNTTELQRVRLITQWAEQMIYLTEKKKEVKKDGDISKIQDANTKTSDRTPPEDGGSSEVRDALLRDVPSTINTKSWEKHFGYGSDSED